MCVKLPHRNLNSDSYPLHPINTFTCKMIITSKVHGDQIQILDILVPSHIYKLPLHLLILGVTRFHHHHSFLLF